MFTACSPSLTHSHIEFETIHDEQERAVNLKSTLWAERGLMAAKLGLLQNLESEMRIGACFRPSLWFFTCVAP